MIAAIALFAAPAAASAATLTNSGGTLTYSAETGKTNLVGFHEIDSDTVQVRRFGGDDDPITATGCTAAANTGGSVQNFDCDGVTRVVASAGDGDDQIDASAAQNQFGVGFNTRLLTIPIEIDLGSGGDFGGGGNGSDTVRGGDGSDFLLLDVSGGGGVGGGGGGADTAFGGNGSDSIQAGRGNDTVNGESGFDFVTGGPDDDTVSGGFDDDTVVGGPGNDKLFGNEGDDSLEGECYFFPCSETSAAPLGNDEFSGGDGLDTVFYWTEAAAGSGPPPTDPTPGVKVTVTIDDQQNDGRAGEPADNVRLDVENVDLSSLSSFFLPGGTGLRPGSGDVTGSVALPNQITGSNGNDVITPLTGNDTVRAMAGDDTINTQDGQADFIYCGAGTDTVNADHFDQIYADCEVQNRAGTANQDEDRPPALTWVRPASNTVMSTTTPNVLEVAATDDRGISQVQFLDDERVVCVDLTAPYTCNYRPQGDDVGRNTLVAIAIDTGQQTTSALRQVRVPLFISPRLTATTKPKRDRRAPYVFRTTGRLSLPSGVAAVAPYEIPGGGSVAAGMGCKGKVSITFKAGKKTISSRRVKLRRNCTYSSRVRFTLPRRVRPKRLRVFVRFQGNDVIRAKNARRYTVRTR